MGIPGMPGGIMWGGMPGGPPIPIIGRGMPVQQQPQQQQQQPPQQQQQ